VVASAPGERTEITFLARAGLVVGTDSAVDGNLSQLNPLGNRASEAPQIRWFCAVAQCIK
jgi:hypothetical protein